MKNRAVDTERLDRNAVDAEITEALGDQLARREHAVEPAIQMLQIYAGRAADRRREAIAEQAREIRMRERDGGNSKPIGDAEHDPGEVIRIGGFDHIGFRDRAECVDQRTTLSGSR